MNDQAGTIDTGAPRPDMGPRRYGPSFTGRVGELYGIYLRNLLLTILTLGIYRFWGKTRLRRYIWNHLVLLNEPFEYSGTGKELFVGFLKAALFVLLMVVAFTVLQIIAEAYVPGLGQFVNWIQSLTFAALIYIGTFAALRYRLGRTRWHGIRFRQEGSAWTYGMVALRGYFFVAITLGLYLPFLNVRLRRYQFENLHYGANPFSFNADGWHLFKPFLIAWLLFIPTLGLSMLWYGAKAMSYYVSSTSYGDVRMQMQITGGQYFSLVVLNLILLMISLGLLTPVVVKRTFDFWCQHLLLFGEPDLQTIRQAAPNTETSGEGLASFLDIDAGIA